eukprot:UN2675
MAFALFAVINIVTGIFVDSAMESNHDDKLVVAHDALDAKKSYLKEMRNIFTELDQDNTGSLSIEEFEQKLCDERIVAFFEAMKLDISDAKKLFVMLDADESNDVDIDEFMPGCWELQGESRALDTKLMQMEVRSLTERVVHMEKMLRSINHRARVSEGSQE